ncbi:MAG: hypothetical protein IT332_13685 [Ardenticatenales bacterium]|nr:hypothetical protein [Ardenticatenales bacterium]
MSGRAGPLRALHAAALGPNAETTVELFPVADDFIDEADPDASFPTASAWPVESRMDGTVRRTLLRFDTSSVPHGVDVVRAELEVFLTSGADGGRFARLFRATGRQRPRLRIVYADAGGAPSATHTATPPPTATAPPTVEPPPSPTPALPTPPATDDRPSPTPHPADGSATPASTPGIVAGRALLPLCCAPCAARPALTRCWTEVASPCLRYAHTLHFLPRESL